MPSQIPVANSVGPMKATLPLALDCFSRTDSPIVIQSGKLAKLVFIEESDMVVAGDRMSSSKIQMFDFLVSA